MKNIKLFLEKFYKGDFKKRQGKKLFHDIEKMKEDENYHLTYDFLNKKYNEEGYGYKSLIKDFNLPITYSTIRTLFKLMEIETRKGTSVVTERLKNFRKNKAIKEFKEKKGWFKSGVQESIQLLNSSSRGIQGYYYNRSMDKYVWLRSSWEYIYAEWLDRNKIVWDVEVKVYKLENGKTYKPDFFIYEDNNLTKIVEIKGHWKDKLWKFKELSNSLNEVDFLLITKIEPFIEKGLNFKKVSKKWKEIRILNKETNKHEYFN